MSIMEFLSLTKFAGSKYNQNFDSGNFNKSSFDGSVNEEAKILSVNFYVHEKREER